MHQKKGRRTTEYLCRVTGVMAAAAAASLQLAGCPSGFNAFTSLRCSLVATEAVRQIIVPSFLDSCPCSIHHVLAHSFYLCLQSNLATCSNVRLTNRVVFATLICTTFLVLSKLILSRPSRLAFALLLSPFTTFTCISPCVLFHISSVFLSVV